MGAIASSVQSGGVALDLKNVRRVFDDLVVIESLDLRVEAGEFLAILGPSGCGKSTLLRMIARLAEPDAGRITFHPDTERFQTAFVFQDAHLLPWRTVLDNAALPLELMGIEREQRYRRAHASLKQVSLIEAEGRYPAQLSGGMTMRVSVARAMVTNPTLLLLDEPFAALDEMTRFRLDNQLRELWRQRAMTVVFVTHSISEAAFLANRAIVLVRRGGRIKLDRRLELPVGAQRRFAGQSALGPRDESIVGRDGRGVNVRALKPLTGVRGSEQSRDRKGALRAAIPALVPFLVITGALELVVRGGLVRAYLVPAPSSVFRAMVESRGELMRAMLTTSASALLGFFPEHRRGNRDRGVSLFLARHPACVLSSTRFFFRRCR